MMKVKTNTKAIEKKLQRMAMKESLKGISAAAFSAKTTGGFEDMVQSRQGEWEDLDPEYILRKRRKGQDERKWVRTGRTLAALNQGALEPVTKLQKGIKIEVSRNAMATLIVQTFRPDKGRKPPAKKQRAIQFLQHQRRPILDWVKGDQKRVKEYVERAVQRILRESGGRL